MDDTQEQFKNSRTEHLKKYQFKKGISGNPGGRPIGAKSMKQYAREYLEVLPEEDRIEFLNSLDHKTIWEMSEGKAKQDLELSGEVKSKIINVDE